MKILYFSVHQILEFDELMLFSSMGHAVFPLGAYFGGASAEPFRPTPDFASPDFSADMAAFFELGGKYHYHAPAVEQVIPAKFVKRFDVVVVMHDLDFLESHWEALAQTTVVWRSIGIGIQFFEARVAALRAKGLKIVRYCATENRAEGYAGHDAIIRFGKIDRAASRVGGRTEILTFSHTYRQRFPAEYQFYTEATRGIPALLGGGGNDGIPGAIGIVDFAVQKQLFAECAAYFYAAGSATPYTLNFMEAWLSGIPVVALNCRAVYPEEQCTFAEVPQLIQHGVNGLLVDTPDEALAIFDALMHDRALSRRIGIAGAEAANAHFSAAVVGPKWQLFLEKIVETR